MGDFFLGLLVEKTERPLDRDDMLLRVKRWWERITFASTFDKVINLPLTKEMTDIPTTLGAVLPVPVAVAVATPNECEPHANNTLACRHSPTPSLHGFTTFIELLDAQPIANTQTPRTFYFPNFYFSQQKSDVQSKCINHRVYEFMSSVCNVAWNRNESQDTRRMFDSRALIRSRDTHVIVCKHRDDEWTELRDNLAFAPESLSKIPTSCTYTQLLFWGKIHRTLRIRFCFPNGQKYVISLSTSRRDGETCQQDETVAARRLRLMMVTRLDVEKALYERAGTSVGRDVCQLMTTFVFG